MGKSYIFIKMSMRVQSWVSLTYSLQMTMGKSYIFIKDAHG